MPLATVNGPDDLPVPITGVLNDPAEVRRIAALADDLFPLMEFGMQVERYRAAWPIAWVERILIEAAAWSTRPRGFLPIVRRLQRWQDEGGPPPMSSGPAPAAGRPGVPPVKSVYGGLSIEEVAAEMGRLRRERRLAAGG